MKTYRPAQYATFVCSLLVAVILLIVGTRDPIAFGLGAGLLWLTVACWRVGITTIAQRGRDALALVGTLITLGLSVAVSIGLPLVALYAFVRFVKWAWR